MKKKNYNISQSISGSQSGVNQQSGAIRGTAVQCHQAKFQKYVNLKSLWQNAQIIS